jgi:hypothetical protein
MLAIDFILWWYGAGWRELVRRYGVLIASIINSLSVPILLRTLFSPWRRIITYSDHSLIEGLKAALDNAVSRLVGFGVRTVVLISALVLVVGAVLAAVVSIVIWPVLPVAAIVLLVGGWR